MATPLAEPPHGRTADGALRRVGVEIEFTGIDPERAARLVQKLYGGRIEQQGRHRFAIEDTALGPFVVELDTVYAHARQRSWKAGAGPKEGVTDRLAWFRDQLARAVGHVARFFLPYEVVAPPIDYPRLPELDRLLETLRAQRAKGAAESMLYGVGLQLNPEVASLEAGHLRRHLQGYMLLSPWLRAAIGVDRTRRLRPFMAGFPRRYVEQVLAPGYRPDLTTLIEDYLAHNPSRYRELDLLPLFAHIDPDRVGRVVALARLKPRPTFHYRLPDARVDDPLRGGVVEEWNRWVRVERLAADEERLNEALDAYRAHRSGELSRGWVEQSRRWVID